MTILSVNKTREPMGAVCAHFLWDGRGMRPFLLGRDPMRKKSRNLAYGAMIAALYVVLTYLQNLIFPDSATMAIQFRASEALCVLAFFTPAAIPGLSLGCLIFNLSYAMALPLDPVVGTLATLGATTCMRLLRRWPVVGLLMPAVWNALLVGWELAYYIGGGFWFNAACVAIGEAAVLLTLGSGLSYGMKVRNLHTRLFGEK